MRKLANHKANKPRAGARPAGVADPLPAGESHNVVNGRATEPKVPFWEAISSLGDKWGTDGYTAYIYRKWPVIDKGESDHFIAKLREPFDPEYLLKTFGSGKYSLQLNDGQGKVVAWKVESVHDPSCPPKVSADEITRDPQNASYWATWGKAGAAGKTDATDNSGDREQSAFLKSILAKAGSFDPRLGEMWERTAKERDELSAALAAKNAPPDMLALVKGIKDLLPQQPAPAPAEKTDLLGIISALKSMQADPLVVMTQAKQLFAPAKTERGADSQPASPLSGVKEVLAVISELKGVLKSDASAAANPAVVTGDGSWQSLVATGLQSLPSTLQSIAALVSVFRGAPPPVGLTTTAPVAARPPAAAFDPYANPAAARNYAQAQNAAATATTVPLSGTQPQPQPQPGPVPPPPAPNGPEDATPPQDAGGQEQQQITGLLVSAIGCMQRGFDGHQFADSIIIMHGDLEYEAIAAQIQTVSIPVVIALAKSTPQAGDYVTRYEPQFTRFLNEFVEGPGADEDAGEETAGPVNGAERAAPRRQPASVS